MGEKTNFRRMSYMFFLADSVNPDVSDWNDNFSPSYRVTRLKAPCFSEIN